MFAKVPEVYDDFELGPGVTIPDKYERAVEKLNYDARWRTLFDEAFFTDNVGLWTEYNSKDLLQGKTSP